MVEQGSYMPKVGGSSPPAPTKKTIHGKKLSKVSQEVLDRLAGRDGDEIEIQRALDVLPSGGRLILKPRTYLFRKPLILKGNFITLDGNGAQIKIGSDRPALIVQGSHNIIKNFIFSKKG